MDIQHAFRNLLEVVNATFGDEQLYAQSQEYKSSQSQVFAVPEKSRTLDEQDNLNTMKPKVPNSKIMENRSTSQKSSVLDSMVVCSREGTPTKARLLPNLALTLDSPEKKSMIQKFQEARYETAGEGKKRKV